MKLSRKSVYHLGVASQIFQNEAQYDDSLPREKRKLNVSVTARMFIRKNAKEISEMFEMIKEEEKNMAEQFHGYFIEDLGYTQFFDGDKSLGKFKESETEFKKELTALRQMSNDVLKNNEQNGAASIESDFEALRRKFIKVGDAAKAQENLRSYNQAYKEFLEDEEGAMDFRIQQIKAKWFENAEGLSQAFVDNYEESGMIDYEDGHLN